MFDRIEQDPDFRRVIETCDNILASKGHDYTQGSDDRLKNFYDSGTRLGLTPLQVLSVLMIKHWSAIETYFQKGQVESEPIEGRIVDMVNYLLLLAKMVAREKGNG